MIDWSKPPNMQYISHTSTNRPPRIDKTQAAAAVAETLSLLVRHCGSDGVLHDLVLDGRVPFVAVTICRRYKVLANNLLVKASLHCFLLLQTLVSPYEASTSSSTSSSASSSSPVAAAAAASAAAATTARRPLGP